MFFLQGDKSEFLFLSSKIFFVLGYFRVIFMRVQYHVHPVLPLKLGKSEMLLLNPPDLG